MIIHGLRSRARSPVLRAANHHSTSKDNVSGLWGEKEGSKGNFPIGFGNKAAQPTSGVVDPSMGRPASIIAQFYQNPRFNYQHNKWLAMPLSR